MKKTFLTAVFALGCFAFVNAQDPADLVSSDAVQETQNIETEIIENPLEELTNDMTESLGNMGKYLNTVNDDGSIYVIGAATTLRPSNMSGFINSRNNAYHIAEMNAKWGLLRMVGEQITSGRAYKLLKDIAEGEDPDAQKKATMLQKATKIVEKSLDKALSELGVSEDEIQQMNTAKKKAAYRVEFKKPMLSLTSLMLQGCAVVKAYEGEMGNDDYQIAVCVKYSPEFHSLASLIKQGGDGENLMGEAKRDKVLDMSVGELMGRLGTFVTFNAYGEMVIYGFGQSEIRKVSSRQSAELSTAYSKARLEAVNNIKNFVAEDLVATEIKENPETLEQYSNGAEAYFSQEKLEQAIESKTTTLNLATKQVRQWRGVHPESNANVAGVVVAWTYSHSKQANQLKKQLNNTNIRNGVNGNTIRKKATKGTIRKTGDDEDL